MLFHGGKHVRNHVKCTKFKLDWQIGTSLTSHVGSLRERSDILLWIINDSVIIVSNYTVTVTLFSLTSCPYSSFQMFSPPVSGGKNRPTTLGSSQFSASGRSWSCQTSVVHPLCFSSRVHICCLKQPGITVRKCWSKDGQQSRDEAIDV